MFAKTIIDSDAFLDMPLSAQCLYFHLGMRADDDGFLNNPKKIQRMVGASDDDFKLLVLKRFVLVFETGVIVLKHWRMHNYIQKDRYKPTVYQEEMAMLTVKENGVYTECIQDGYTGKDSIGKDKLVKDSIGKPIGSDTFAKFAGEDKELLAALREFESMRNRIKKPMTDGAKKRLLSKLEKLPRKQWIPVLNQSVDHCWQDIYLLDNGKGNKKTNNIFLEIMEDEYGQTGNDQSPFGA